LAAIARSRRPEEAMSDPALARCLTELEAEVSGEKIVTRHILEQLRANTDILLQMQREITQLRTEMISDMGCIRQEVIGLHQKVDKLADRVALQDAHLLSFEAKFAHIAADAMRDVLKIRSD
jgi:hypothetical protein